MLHVISVRCVARDLHTIAYVLEAVRGAVRRFALLVNAIIIIVVVIIIIIIIIVIIIIINF